MQTLIRLQFIILFCFFFTITLQAATMTWLGNNAAWNDATQWDTGVVPTNGDDVIIPSGIVFIFNGQSESATRTQLREELIWKAAHLKRSKQLLWFIIILDKWYK